MSASLDELYPGPRRRVAVVLGMHRSGTSAVAGSLHRLGVDFGPRLMPATPDNPRGYFEHIDLVNLHDRLLLALGGAWDETATFLAPGWADDPRALAYREGILDVLRRDFPPAAADRRPWGLKDPRLCRLLPFWEPLWPAAGSAPVFVLVWRPAREVAASLARREGFSTAKSHLLWLLHTLEAERHTRPHARVWLDYREFLQDPARALGPVREMLGRAWPVGEDLEPFVDPALDHGGGEGTALERLPAWVEEAEAALRHRLTGGDEAGLRAAFDDLRDRTASAAELFAPAPDALGGDLRHQLEVSRQQARWYEEEWRKTRARAEALGTRLEAKRAELDRAKQVVLKYKIIDQS